MKGKFVLKNKRLKKHGSTKSISSISVIELKFTNTFDASDCYGNFTNFLNIRLKNILYLRKKENILYYINLILLIIECKVV